MQTLKNSAGNDLYNPVFDAGEMAGIELIEKELFNALSDSAGTVREMCSHILNAGGKRIRPMLVLYSGLVFSGPTENIIQASVAAELIHMASLVHDDIIDSSDLRRNKPSVNRVWGNHFAVLCGDYLFARAFGILSRIRPAKSMEYMVAAIQDMCHGEIIQAEARYSLIDTDMYYEIIRKKTASFLECCCLSGGAAAGASAEMLEALGKYGLNLGFAFQILDDILDFTGDVKVMGKPRGEDLRQGNITLPVLMLMQEDGCGGRLSEYITRGAVPEDAIDEVTRQLADTGILKECYGIVNRHIDAAKDCVDCLPQNTHTVFLRNLADKLRLRDN